MPDFSARRRSMRAAFIAAALTIFAAPAHGQTFWQAILGPESPGATGSGTASFTLNGSLLSISASWSGLGGTTTVSHIHCCTTAANGGTAGVAVTPSTLPGFPVGTQSGTYNTVIDLTLAGSYTTTFVNTFGGGTIAGAEAALLAGFDANRAYFNIHTNAYPAGEIRGFITRVPEPGTVALLLTGLAGLGLPVLRRRQRR